MKMLLQKRRLLYLAAVIMLSYVMIHRVVRRVDIYRMSMYPNYVEGDIILVDKVCFYFSEIERFDAVVFQYEHQDDEFYIKRAIGLSGETVQIVDGQVYIDGALLDDIHATEPIEKPRRAAEPVVLGEDEYFLLGDNQNDNSDSRGSDVGNISVSQIIGRAGVCI